MGKKKSEEPKRTEQEIQADYSNMCAELGDMLLRTYVRLQTATVKFQTLNLELAEVKANEGNETKA